ncbi:hypothetical protein [Mucilaginibacter sp.]|jgi:hypothetical protein|uniref:hypothetical protein n=1 Tax=Mucilaginibacter sp. TaxID=1882438 RepID=UPI003563CD03
MKKCIVSLATKNSRYVDGLARLSNSLRDNASGIDFLGFIHERSVGAPLHTENNYAFKVYTIQKAIDAGYTEILWLDCSVWAVAPIQPLFDIISEQGYWFEGNGCWLGDYTNDVTLEYYGIDREVAKEIPMIQSGFMGFDTRTVSGSELWNGLKSACELGLFNGDWANHRHDQSCLSAILYSYFVKFNHLPEYVQYAGLYDKQSNDSIILRCQGL